MYKKNHLVILFILMISLVCICAQVESAGLESSRANQFGQIAVNQLAPQFSLTDTKGKAISLADFKGKFVRVGMVQSRLSFCKKTL